MKIEALINKAKEAQERAYVPYSNFKVGAAVEAEDGSVYTGCNIENAAYTPTICAERVAIFKAISEGHKKINKIAVIAGEDMGYPCGVCRQVLREFGAEAEIIIAKDMDQYKLYSLDDLLPHSFGPDDLE